MTATFQDVENLGTGINSAINENGPSTSADGQTIYYHKGPHFTQYQRLWSATRSPDGSYGDAQDLGDAVNGDGVRDRRSRLEPSISSDERFLFFEINEIGPDGEGGEDIWVSMRSSTDDAFGAPININELWPGTEINTLTIEQGVHISPDWPAIGSKIYFARWVEGNAYDIFQATWVPEPSAIGMSAIGMLSVLVAARRRHSRC